ncbi:MAG: DNA polymerase I [Marinifilaceae bacterium]
MKKLFLLDAYALIYRSYYAFIKNPRITTTGINTSAVLGFCNFVLELIEQEHPTHIAVVFDPAGPTFRHEMYDPYKAQRPPMPEDLRKSLPYIRQIIDGLGIRQVEVAGYEADDVIGTLAKKGEQEGFTVYMITPDKDYAQLVSDHIFMYKPGRGGEKSIIWGIPEVLDNFGIERVDQVIDILGLMGDTADNVPGCAGIGPKSAAKLVYTFGDIQGIYDNIEQLKGKQKESLIQCHPTVMMSRELVTICTTVPTEEDPEKLARRPIIESELEPIFKELELFSIMKRVLSSAVEADEKELNVEKKELNLRDMRGKEQELFDNLSKCGTFATVLSWRKGDTLYNANPSAFYFSGCMDGCDYITYPESPNEEKAFLTMLSNLFAQQHVTVIGDELKELLIWLQRKNIEVNAQLFDIKIAHYLLNPEVSHDLNRIALEFLGRRLGEATTHATQLGTQLSLFDEVIESHDEAALRLSEQAEALFMLKQKLDDALQKAKAHKLFTDVEIPLMRVLAHMEFEGVAIDKQALKDIADKLNARLSGLESTIYSLAGETFNIGSPKQLGEVLFERMGIKTTEKKTKSGQYSTSEQVLSKLAADNEIIAHILEYRGLKKLVSTYAEALPNYIDPITQKIHTCFNQTETATGRLSSTNPNLQNIPIRSEEGREIRKAFVTGDADYIFFSADYSQVELRLMAHLSGDEGLISAFNNNLDIHTATAAKIFNVPLDEVTTEMRRRAKTANFGIIYGISSWGLAERLNISRKEGKELIDGYFAMYPGVKTYMENCVEKARKQEYVETLLGRRRYLRDINSRNAIVRGMAERNAINAPLQGSAADIIKMAMIAIDKELRERGMRSKMILQVHDELNFKCAIDEKEQLEQLVIDKMEHVVKLAVELTVSAGFGNNWYEAH